MDMIEKAKSELSEIEQKLEELQSLQKRRQHLLQFIELGRALFEDATSEAQATSLVTADVRMYRTEFDSDRKRLVYRRKMIQLADSDLFNPDNTVRMTAKDQILSAAREYIAKNGVAPTKQLIEYIRERGIEIGGSDKVLTVSSVLSRSDEFKSDRAAGGWVLEGTHQ